MLEKTISLLKKSFAVTEKPLGADAVQKVGPMKFRLRQFAVEGVGNLSLMEGSAMLGLMKMDTAILSPLEKDAPLFSYDRIQAMGNDTLIVELYDTLVERSDAVQAGLKRMEACKEDLAAIPDHDLGKHWYDPIKLPESVSKRGKKCGGSFDAFYEKYLGEYIAMLGEAPGAELQAKREKTAQYVGGLFENGGPSTDQFVKALGKEQARELFDTVIFGIGSVEKA